MYEPAAQYWAGIAHEMLISKSMDALPQRDPRIYGYSSGVQAGLRAFYRVDSSGAVNSNGEVQVIEIYGPVMQEDYCGAPGMATIQQTINAVQVDDSVKSIVLWIDSPGGTVTGTENLANAIKASKKPVVSFVNSMMASAAYWIGSSATEIIADSANQGTNTLIGSIGTKVVLMDNSKALEKNGVRMISIYADKSCRKGKYSDDLMAGNYDRIKQELNAINETFLSAVKSNRPNLRLDLENVLDGEVYNVKEAIKYGLIDKMADFGYAVKRSLVLAKTIRA